MADIDTIRKRLDDCPIPVGMRPVIQVEKLHEMMTYASRYPEDVAALLARIDELESQIVKSVETEMDRHDASEERRIAETAGLKKLVGGLTEQIASGKAFQMPPPMILDKETTAGVLRAEIERLKAENKAAPAMLAALRGVSHRCCGEYPFHPETLAVLDAIAAAEGTGAGGTQ